MKFLCSFLFKSGFSWFAVLSVILANETDYNYYQNTTQSHAIFGFSYIRGALNPLNEQNINNGLSSGIQSNIEIQRIPFNEWELVDLKTLDDSKNGTVRYGYGWAFFEFPKTPNHSELKEVISLMASYMEKDTSDGLKNSYKSLCDELYKRAREKIPEHLIVHKENFNTHPDQYKSFEIDRIVKNNDALEFCKQAFFAFGGRLALEENENHVYLPLSQQQKEKFPVYKGQPASYRISNTSLFDSIRIEYRMKYDIGACLTAQNGFTFTGLRTIFD